MCKYAVQKLSFAVRYVPYRYKTQQMCDKAMLIILQHNFFQNVARLTKCVIKLSKYYFAFYFIPDFYKIQEKCGTVVSDNPFKIAQIALFSPENYT